MAVGLSPSVCDPRFHVNRIKRSVRTTTSITISTSSSGDSSDGGVEEPDFFLVEAKFDDSTEEFEVEPSFASRGWVELGTFDIQSTEVEVVVTTGTSQFSVADAVKWTMRRLPLRLSRGPRIWPHQSPL